MDIIMPNLDGVSACHLIRQFDNTPIIAMTSNIRADDISMYFQHGKLHNLVPGECADWIGMNDVLPKPFTKEGLLNMLEKHLGHLKKPDFDMIPQSASTMAQHSTAHSIKDESSPAHSPSTMSNWHSPSQFSGISPGGAGGYMPPGNQYPMDQGGMQTYDSFSPAGKWHYLTCDNSAQRRPISDMAGGPVDDLASDPKRPRIYATTNNAMNQMRQGAPR
jgi:osomolarity two-component system, response regulator SKN7